MKEETFKLTPSQKELKVKFTKFLDSSEKIFLLTGKPGVGKTTMTKIGFSNFIESDLDTNAKGSNAQIVGITLAHKAKNVLGEHIPNVYTFAKAYGLKEVFKENGARSFEYDNKVNEKNPPIGHATIPVFVHDEVSQYTAEMLRIVLETTSLFSKIVFLGDRAQLPPIDPNGEMKPDEDSPVFNLEIPDFCKHELTERVRQTKDNPILELSDVIREEIFGSQNVGRIINMIKKPVLLDGKGYDFVTYAQIIEHFSKQTDYYNTCIIAFRNKTVDDFNITIRNILLNNPHDYLVEGDIVCMKDNYYHTPADQVVYVLNNSDVYTIGKTFTRKFRYSHGKHSYEIEAYVGEIKGDKWKHIYLPTFRGEGIYQAALSELAEMCRMGKYKWADAFWPLKKMFCQLSYGYALTAYKVQGSTFKSVYVDINDILLTRPLTPKRKLQTIYTAITRAQENVYFIKSN